MRIPRDSGDCRPIEQARPGNSQAKHHVNNKLESLNTLSKGKPHPNDVPCLKLPGRSANVIQLNPQAMNPLCSLNSAKLWALSVCVQLKGLKLRYF